MTSAYSKPSVGKPGVTRTRKTRIVCISDTHNQTPKLPPGDVLIHAGDLTNQGSFAELKKSVEWLEKADFEAKIVVAGSILSIRSSQCSITNEPTGNHEITLDEPFFREKETKWKWPEPQDPAACRKLLTDSSSITYLENSAATIYLTKRQTCFRVFGSPYSPGRRGWAFQYWGEDEAENMWRGIEDDADIVITHTPAHGHCDAATKDDRSGCASLTQRIAEIRPLLHICGHIHEARGVERVKWSPGASSPTNRRTVETTEYWKDPGAGNKKISLVDLTAKVGRSLDNAGRLTRHVLPDSARDRLRGQRDAVAQHEGPRQLHGVEESNPTSSLEDIALCSEAGVERWTSKAGGAIECRLGSEVGRSSEVDAHTDAPQQQQQRNETVMINAAFLGPRIAGKAMEFNKPIVVDVELPVWDFDTQNV